MVENISSSPENVEIIIFAFLKILVLMEDKRNIAQTFYLA